MLTSTAVQGADRTLTAEQFDRLQAALLRRTRKVTDRSTAEEAVSAAWVIWCRAKPDITEEEALLRWLTTVARHEAYHENRRDRRNGEAWGEAVIDHASGQGEDPHERVEVYDELRAAAHILGTLKPQEAKALRLLAEGYGYTDIMAMTGWTYTKVNRCLTEGRAKFRARAADRGQVGRAEQCC